jgi:integrase
VQAHGFCTWGGRVVLIVGYHPADGAGHRRRAQRRRTGLTIVSAEDGRPIAGPWAIERTVRDARTKVEGLPAQFRFHDLRHYFASLLIASGLDVKVVQARLRHTSAKTTLDTYGHLWPDKDESSRAAVAAVYALRAHSEGGRGASGSA